MKFTLLLAATIGILYTTIRGLQWLSQFVPQ